MHPGGRAFVSLRVTGAIVCNLCLHWTLLILFIFLYNAELSDLLSWLRSAINFHFSLRFWLFAFPLVLVTLAQGIVSCREYVLSPVCPSNRVAELCNSLSVHNLVVCFLYAYIGFSIPLIYTSVEDNEMSSFEIACHNNTCLSEERLFLVLEGIWMGIYYFVHNHVFQSKYLNFPFLQQKKSVMIKSSIRPAFSKSLRYSCFPVFLFLVLYYIWGVNVRDFFSHLFAYDIYPGDLDSIPKLLSVKRLFHLWLFSTVTVFTLKMMEVMVRIYLMQRYEFTMYHTAVPSSHFVMEEALARTDIPIIRHLAFWDLSLLSEHDPVRRKEIYSLSHPGGHPYTWRGIKKQCFDVIDSFTLLLEQAVKKPVVQSPSVPLNISKCQRFETTEYFVNSKPAKPLISNEMFNAIFIYVRQVVYNYMFTKLTLFGESKPVKYLFGDVPKHRVNHLILHSLPVAWAAESLSFLLCASLSEDNFGVLQSDIPAVISILLRLQTALDSLHKNPLMLKKFHSPQSDGVTKMHNTLVSKVKRSLYHLAIHFKPFVYDLQLNKSDEIRLLAYCSFKE